MRAKSAVHVLLALLEWQRVGDKLWIWHVSMSVAIILRAQFAFFLHRALIGNWSYTQRGWLLEPCLLYLSEFCSPLIPAGDRVLYTFRTHPSLVLPFTSPPPHTHFHHPHPTTGSCFMPSPPPCSPKCFALSKDTTHLIAFTTTPGNLVCCRVI